MKHEKYIEQILFSLLGELSGDERRSLDAHLAECAACRAELEEARAQIAMIQEAGVTGPSDELLREARRELHDAIAGEANLAGVTSVAGTVESPDKNLTQDRAWSQPGRSGFPFDSLRGWVGWFTPRRVALAATAAVAIGFLAGYLVFGGKGTVVPAVVPVDTARRPEAAKVDREMGAASYDNVRLAGIDPRSSEVELEYDMVRPVRLKAGIDDDRVQSILAQAVMNDENAGARLQAINTIGAYIDSPRNQEIKQALIHAVRTDSNPGVRKQALYVLYQLPFDDEIKDACLHVLAADDNEGLRIAAINILAVAMLDGALKGDDVFNAVGARLQKDENEYIRIQSGAFQQEVNGHGN